jgi:uncharacterized membrane protein
MDQQTETPSAPAPAAQKTGTTQQKLGSSRWMVILAFLVLGLIFAFLPARLTIGPTWLPLVVTVLLISLILAAIFFMEHPAKRITIRLLFFALLTILTLALVGGVILLIVTLPDKTEKQAGGLLRDAALLWISNIILFALWYWEVDGGGHLQRQLLKYQAADFMFPQQVDGNKQGWAPLFLDYLFLAFTGATALSPADTFPLTRKAKGLMMMEAVLSMIIIVVLAARAINIL